jgi:hypothetical protein
MVLKRCDLHVGEVRQGYKHTLRICNAYGLSMSKVVIQMRHIVAFVRPLPVVYYRTDG